MLKKLISVILAALLLSSAVVVPCSAAFQDDQTENDVLRNVIEEVAAEFISADPNDEITVDERLVERIKSENGDEITARELAKSLSSYVFVKYDRETIDNLSTEIAEDCVYSVEVTGSGVRTIFIAVDIVKYPELLNVGVFHDAVIKIAEKQIGLMPSDSFSIGLLDYNRLAGELAMHIILYAAVKPFYDSKFLRSGIVERLYNSVSVADLNINEYRLSNLFMIFLGSIIMDIVYKLAQL